jgi:hypothetical protein
MAIVEQIDAFEDWLKYEKLTKASKKEKELMRKAWNAAKDYMMGALT